MTDKETSLILLTINILAYSDGYRVEKSYGILSTQQRGNVSHLTSHVLPVLFILPAETQLRARGNPAGQRHS